MDQITTTTEVDETVIQSGIIPEFRAGAMENPGPEAFAGAFSMLAGRLPETPRRVVCLPQQQQIVDSDAARREQQARLQHDQ